MGNDLLVFRASLLRCRGELVEGRPAPPVPTSDVTFWVAGVALMDTVVATLPKGETDDRQRMLDLYSITTCDYRASVRLPRRVMALAYAEGTFYFTYEDPAPALIALRWKPASN